MVEAMACGVPSIVYDLSPMNEVIRDGVTGFIEKDAEGIRRRIVELLGGKTRFEKAKILKEARKHSVERFAEAYESVYADYSKIQTRTNGR